MGAQKCPDDGVFWKQYEMTFRQVRNGRFSPNLAIRRESWLKRRFCREIWKKVSIQGSFAPKPQTLRVKQVPHSERDTGQVVQCRGILFIPRCSPKARELPSSVNFSVRCTVAELLGVKVAKFSDFGLFLPNKTPKTYLPVTSLQPRGYIAEWFQFFHVIVEGNGSFAPGSGVFIRLVVGELWTPKLAQIFAHGTWLYPYRMLLHGASDLD